MQEIAAESAKSLQMALNTDWKTSDEDLPVWIGYDQNLSIYFPYSLGLWIASFSAFNALNYCFTELAIQETSRPHSNGSDEIRVYESVLKLPPRRRSFLFRWKSNVASSIHWNRLGMRRSGVDWRPSLFRTTFGVSKLQRNILFDAAQLYSFRRTSRLTPNFNINLQWSS